MKDEEDNIDTSPESNGLLKETPGFELLDDIIEKEFEDEEDLLIKSESDGESGSISSHFDNIDNFIEDDVIEVYDEEGQLVGTYGVNEFEDMKKGLRD